jgi:hypothetical protein
MNTVMWGHYGNNGKGVCIRIDISKIKFSKNTFREKVVYEKKITSPALNMPDIPKFVEKHKKQYFFTKTKEWEYENEYRVVSKEKEDEFIDISGAISEIIITSLFGITDYDDGGFNSNLFKNILKPLISSSNTIKVLEFCPIGICGAVLVDEQGIEKYPKVDLSNLSVNL